MFDFLENSSFGPAMGGKRIDTHASVVFLGGDRALKIKRAVRLPFLDYSTLEKRKRACEEELKVNAGNAPELYRRVVAITRADDGGLKSVEAALRSNGRSKWRASMRSKRWIVSPRRNRSGRLLRLLLLRQSCSHTKRCRVRMAKPGSPPFQASSTATPQNFVPCGNRRRRYRSARCRQPRSRRDAPGLLKQRAGQGFVRRCHGDLHLANIALVDGKPLLFDAIEFDPVIATTDVLYDLAFTLMDLIYFDNEAASNAVFNHYLAGTSDENLDGLAVLPLFLSLRAAIRALCCL